MANGEYLIPFDKDGNQMHYPENSYRYEDGVHTVTPPDWRVNQPFEDLLMYDGYERGRSAAYFRFKTSMGKTVMVFMSDMSEMIPYMNCGAIEGVFQFTKKGQNYGCKRIGDVA